MHFFEKRTASGWQRSGVQIVSLEAALKLLSLSGDSETRIVTAKGEVVAGAGAHA